MAARMSLFRRDRGMARGASFLGLAIGYNEGKGRCSSAPGRSLGTG